MNVVDSSAWLEYFADGPNAGSFAPPIQDLGNLAAPSLCVTEVFRRLFLQRGLDAALRAGSGRRRWRGWRPAGGSILDSPSRRAPRSAAAPHQPRDMKLIALPERPWK